MRARTLAVSLLASALLLIFLTTPAVADDKKANRAQYYSVFGGYQCDAMIPPGESPLLVSPELQRGGFKDGKYTIRSFAEEFDDEVDFKGTEKNLELKGTLIVVDKKFPVKLRMSQGDLITATDLKNGVEKGLMNLPIFGECVQVFDSQQNLRVSLAVKPKVVTKGEAFAILITFSNDGPQALRAGQVNFTVTLPAELTVNIDGRNIENIFHTGGEITGTLGNLARPKDVAVLALSAGLDEDYSAPNFNVRVDAAPADPAAPANKRVFVNLKGTRSKVVKVKQGSATPVPTPTATPSSGSVGVDVLFNNSDDPNTVQPSCSFVPVSLTSTVTPFTFNGQPGEMTCSGRGFEVSPGSYQLVLNSEEFSKLNPNLKVAWVEIDYRLGFTSKKTKCLPNGDAINLPITVRNVDTTHPVPTDIVVSVRFVPKSAPPFTGETSCTVPAS